MTEWRDIPGHEGRYRVSDDGRVYSIVSGRLLSLIPHKDGYRRVKLSVNGVGISPLVHRLVLLTFVGPCPEGHVACHYDGDPANNNLSNLRWDTESANQADTKRHGSHPAWTKTSCIRGHEFTPENTYTYPKGAGKIGRQCKTCHADRDREYKAARKAKREGTAA